MSGLFNSVQTPVILHEKYQFNSDPNKKMPFKSTLTVEKVDKMPEVALDGTVTVAFLNQFYKITSNAGNPSQKQSVFETSSESFSQRLL